MHKKAVAKELVRLSKDTCPKRIILWHVAKSIMKQATKTYKRTAVAFEASRVLTFLRQNPHASEDMIRDIWGTMLCRVAIKPDGSYTETTAYKDHVERSKKSSEKKCPPWVQRDQGQEESVDTLQKEMADVTMEVTIEKE
mgnify:CR=1 FL=1